MKISVIVPVYNAKQYLVECIESILRQTYTDYEIILVNDGSVDGSDKICDEYAKHYNFIKTYHNDNNGQLYSRQYGINNANGEYCVFVDSDDYIESYCLERLVEKIEKEAPDCIIYGLRSVEKNNTVKVMTDDCETIIFSKQELYKKVLFDEDYNSMCRKAVKTELLKHRTWNEYYYIRYGEDLLQSLPVYKDSHKIMIIPDILYNYRMNAFSVTHMDTLEKFEIDNPVRPLILDYLIKENVFSKEDFKKYKQFCTEVFVAKIIRVAMLKSSYKNKITVYKEISNTDYYKNFLQSGREYLSMPFYKCCVFCLFKHKLYIPLISLLTFYYN